MPPKAKHPTRSPILSQLKGEENTHYFQQEQDWAQKDRLVSNFIFFFFFRSLPHPVPNTPPRSLLPPPLYDLICNDLLHFFRAAAEWATFRKKKKLYILKKKKRELLDYTFDISANISQAEDFRLILSLIVQTVTFLQEKYHIC